MTSTVWAADREPIYVEGDVQKPTVLKIAKPVYPARERAERVEGAVTMRAIVTEKGKVKDPTLVQSSGNENLDRSALKCLKKWTFHPATLNGKPVAVHYILTINFSVSDS
jgi:protein TonB